MTIKEEQDVAAAIKEMRGDEWWRRDGEATYNSLAMQLVRKGFTVDEAADLLGSAFSAAAGEYGG